VSILANADLEKILTIPPHVRPVAYLCLGYVSEFAAKPDLERTGWLPRMDLANVVCYEQWGVHQSEQWSALGAAIGKMSEGKREDNILSCTER
jgi:5,6-dimethylbenzimidazole synthase